jgi:hypothetical protein
MTISNQSPQIVHNHAHASDAALSMPARRKVHVRRFPARSKTAGFFSSDVIFRVDAIEECNFMHITRRDFAKSRIAFSLRRTP